MAQPIQIGTVTCNSFRVTERTEWYFLEVSDLEGASEVVEFTCGDYSSKTLELLVEILSRLREISIADERELVGMLNLRMASLHSDRALAASVSALRTAVVGLQARHESTTLTEALGGEVLESVPLYANINRSLLG